MLQKMSKKGTGVDATSFAKIIDLANIKEENYRLSVLEILIPDVDN